MMISSASQKATWLEINLYLMCYVKLLKFIYLLRVKSYLFMLFSKHNSANTSFNSINLYFFR